MAENESPNGFQRARFPEGEVERVLSQLEETRREILRLYTRARVEYASIEQLAGQL
jgi:hypothetical protein